MRNPFKRICEKWRQRRLSRAADVLDILKIRYHTFRVLLAHNETSLDLLRSVDDLLRSPSPSWDNLTEQTEELLNVTYEMVDALNRLTEDRHSLLYERQQSISQAVKAAINQVVAQPLRGARCIPLNGLSLDSAALVGGKAATLGLLMQKGFPIPDGFVVTARACSEILTANGLDVFIRRRMQRFESGSFDAEDISAEADEILKRILDSSIPAELETELRLSYETLTGSTGSAVSVRSSALVEDRVEHSFAGQFKSVLNVASFQSLNSALKEVLASNYSARSILYRLNAALPLNQHDMAVFCQLMVPARAAGGLFTLDPAAPDSGRMLISAVPGLGVSAVGGSAPADLYRPLREQSRSEDMSRWTQVVLKTQRTVAADRGGILEERISQEEGSAPVLSEEEVHSLVRCGRMIEGLIGKPQDIEWAISPSGEIFILQSRDIRLSAKSRQAAQTVVGKPLLKGGVSASPGRCVGRVKIVHSMSDMELWRKGQSGPGIMVLHQSQPDAAGWLPEFEGVVVDLGNPADHLSCVAREYSRPMLTGTGKATEVLLDAQWVIVDADSATVFEAPEEVWATAASQQPRGGGRKVPAKGTSSPELDSLRELIEPLNLTDAYGPTFSIRECKSLHDIIRYTHEMAVLSMFDYGDIVLEEAGAAIHRLDEGMPFQFLIIDLGGGLAPGQKGMVVHLSDVLSTPLLALWKGIATPGLRWSQPPPVPGISGLFTRSILDGRSARPVGSQNYAFITRDYLNLNARVDYHFAMADAVCGANPRGNYIRFRFKGGGTSVIQRERRAEFLVEVLRSHNFFADRQGDLVTASIQETRREEIENRLVMLGRLLGFSRLLDASMRDDTVPRKLAQAFLDEDYALESLSDELT